MAKHENIKMDDDTKTNIEIEGADSSSRADETGGESLKEEAHQEADKSETSDAKDEYNELNEKYMRLMADFQNQRRRFDKEKADIYQYANESIVKDLIAVIDNFDIALDVAKGAEPKFVEGMEMILSQLSEVLTKAGVTEINALGEEFDPNFHSAVMMEDSDEYESGKVCFVIQKGYVLNGKVVRPSMVKVAN